MVAVGGLVLAWTGQQRLKAVEQELIKRQQDLGERAAEARTLARQADATTRDATARLAVMEARMAELAVQRTQVDELLRSLIAAREENLLAEIDAALRVAVQHAAITGNLEPLSAALTQADERLRRSPRPRLELVRLAVAKDLDRVRTASALDLTGMTVRIDEMVRVVDDLPLIATIDRRGVRERRAERPKAADAPPAGSGAVADGHALWPDWLDEGVRQLLTLAWSGVRDLVRVTRVDDPQAALLAPEQAFFLRENVKLRLLNARLALLSRQFDIARADLAEAGGLLDRYFDRSSRRVAAAAEQMRQMASQVVQGPLPRADNTLAALATALASR
jgi:uroporphyrin-3 C-methyltransferase